MTAPHYTTLEAAKLLGMAVRSVQMMVDRGELDSWKTPGGHRRIDRRSVERCLSLRSKAGASKKAKAKAEAAGQPRGGARGPKVLLIEDSVHFQNLISMIVRSKLGNVNLRVAADGIVGLAMYGQWRPDVLIVDILLPGIDGAALITSLRTHEEFRGTQLIVVTSLTKAQRAPYELVLQDVPVIHKPHLVAELPALLRERLSLAQAA